MEGGESRSFLAYVNGGAAPRGREIGAAAKTLAGAGWTNLPKSFKGDKSAQAKEVGKVLASAAKKAGVKNYFVEMNLDLLKGSYPYLKNLSV